MYQLELEEFTNELDVAEHAPLGLGQLIALLLNGHGQLANLHCIYTYRYKKWHETAVVVVRTIHHAKKKKKKKKACHS